MGFIDSLKTHNLIVPTRTGASKSPEEARRIKFRAYLESQFAAVAPGKKFDLDDIRKKVKKSTKKTKPHYFEKDGVWYFTPRYGSRVVALKKDQPTIEAGSKQSDLESLLIGLNQATRDGELDSALATASERNTASKAALTSEKPKRA